jgi:hypothetical protein
MAYFNHFCVTDRENPRTIQNTQSPGQDLNPGPPEYWARVLTTRLRGSMKNKNKNEEINK